MCPQRSTRGSRNLLRKDAHLFPQKAGNGAVKVLATCAVCSARHCHLHCFPIHPLLSILFLSQQTYLYRWPYGFRVNLSPNAALCFSTATSPVPELGVCRETPQNYRSHFRENRYDQSQSGSCSKATDFISTWGSMGIWRKPEPQEHGHTHH